MLLTAAACPDPLLPLCEAVLPVWEELPVCEELLGFVLLPVCELCELL